MKIICDCGNLIVEGEIKPNAKGKRRFFIEDKPKGEIYKNNSNNPDNWTGLCSLCQKNKSKEVKKHEGNKAREARDNQGTI